MKFQMIRKWTEFVLGFCSRCCGLFPGLDVNRRLQASPCSVETMQYGKTPAGRGLSLVDSRRFELLTPTVSM